VNIVFSHAFGYTVGTMEKAEIQQISSFLSDVYEGIFEQDESHIQQYRKVLQQAGHSLHHSKLIKNHIILFDFLNTSS
jgi:hypothetical protein